MALIEEQNSEEFYLCSKGTRNEKTVATEIKNNARFLTTGRDPRTTSKNIRNAD